MTNVDQFAHVVDTYETVRISVVTLKTKHEDTLIEHEYESKTKNAIIEALEKQAAQPDVPNVVADALMESIAKANQACVEQFVKLKVAEHEASVLKKVKELAEKKRQDSTTAIMKKEGVINNLRNDIKTKHEGLATLERTHTMKLSTLNVEKARLGQDNARLRKRVAE